MKRIVCVLLTLCMLFTCVVSFAACGTKSPSADIVLSVGAYPDTVDPALNSDVNGGSYIVHTFSGLVGWEQNKQGGLELVPQCAKALPDAVPAADGMVSYTYELRDGLKWSDGTALTAADFVYAWNRAASPVTGADYGYMFEVIDGYAAMIETDDQGKLRNPAATLNVTASEDGRSLTVVLPVDVPYFHELTAFPVYMPVRKDLIDTYGDAWATNVDTYIGNGPYKVLEMTRTQMVLEKNEHYFDADRIVTDRLAFAFSEDDVSLLTNYRNGSYLFIDSVPNNEIASLQSSSSEEFYVAGQLGTYYISFNVNDPALADFTQEEKTKIRKALGLLIDRNYICKEIGQAGQVPAAGFVAMGLTEPDGTAFVDRNGPNRDGAGYYSVAPESYSANCAQAVQLLSEVAQSSQKFTVTDGKVAGFPSLTYLTDSGTAHEAVAAYLQQVWGNYGITVKVEVQERATFLNTRKAGDYSVARNGWVGDYNDPISFLDMWTTVSGNNDCQFGKGEHKDYIGYGDGKTWADTYDAIIATIKTTSDAKERFALMHQAEDILMETGAICPIYYYTDIYMCSPKLKGFFSSPLGIKYFMYTSVQE